MSDEGRSVQLRDYQLEAVSNLRNSVRSGSKAPLLQAATGLGKSVIISEMIRSAVAKGRSALVLVPRRQLAFQTHEKLAAFGVEAGIIMSGERPSLMPSVQVASVPTLYKRCFDEDGEPIRTEFQGRGMPLPPADVLVIDEAHATFGKMAQKIIAQYPNAIRIGMTATPARSDGRGLGEVYDSIVHGPSVRWAMDNGYLSELRYYGPSEWDMSQVKVQGGDYQQKQLAEAVNQPKLVGDVVANWARIAPDRITVVFAVDRKHARALHEAFTQHGFAAEYIDGATENDDRHAIFRRLESGESRVLCSVAVVDMGWDMPCASCAVLARPTKSVARYLQAVGRILRPAPGKEDAVLIDHTGAVRELGFVDDHFDWTLEGVKRQEPDRERKPSEQTTVTCPACSAVIKPGPECPECGQEMKSDSKRAVEAKEAELQEIERKDADRKRREWTVEQKKRFFAELVWIAEERGNKKGWALHRYKDKFGALPPNYHIGPVEPSKIARGWVTYCDMKKRAKARKAQSGADKAAGAQ